MYRVGIIGIAFGASVAGATPARAQSGGLAVSAAAISDYRFRGISQSTLDPALQGSIEYRAGSGWRGGVWASTLGNNNADAEIDLYAGYEARSGGFRYGVSGYGYFFPGSRGLSYGEVQGELGYSIGPAEARVFAAYAPSQRNTGRDDLYVGGGLSTSIPTTPFTLAVKAGYEDGFFESKLDWQAELGWARGPFSASLAYVDTDLKRGEPLARLGRAGVIATAGIGF